jgi:ABC-type nitrate/sulfonate/bicarbonate transport system permease component
LIVHCEAARGHDMPEKPMPYPSPTPAPLPPRAPRPTKERIGRFFREFFALRKEVPQWKALFFSLLCLALVFGLWWFVTHGEEPILSRYTLSSPAETLESFHSLWFERYLTLNTYASLKRVVLGFGLAALIGIPLGVLCGCFARVNAFFLPLSIFGRNIPIAALIPLTFSFFGIGEWQKIMFIFIACVAFVITDTARAVADVGSTYIDTAYTLGASRRQVILKVLVPLAMPSIFNSLRLLFGLAFGYIMLAELIKFGAETGGLGDIIATSQREGPREHIYLVLLIIPLVALALDRMLFWIQKELFPHRYGGTGILNQGLGVMLHGWEDTKGWFFRPAVAAGSQTEASDHPRSGGQS